MRASVPATTCGCLGTARLPLPRTSPPEQLHLHLRLACTHSQATTCGCPARTSSAAPSATATPWCTTKRRGRRTPRWSTCSTGSAQSRCALCVVRCARCACRAAPGVHASHGQRPTVLLHCHTCLCSEKETQGPKRARRLLSVRRCSASAPSLPGLCSPPPTTPGPVA